MVGRRNEQLIRQWKLIRYLSEHPTGCQTEELCRVLGVRLRTLYRDYDAVEAAGFPVMRRREGKQSIWTIGS
jgi:predicted DNA-binding transcriptional regulator YafY